MRVPGLHKVIKRDGRRHPGRHRRDRPEPQTRWQLAGAVAAVVTLAALATASLPEQPVTGGYDAAGSTEAPLVDPFLEDEAIAEFVDPEQLDAVPAGPGRVAKPVQMVLSGAPVIKSLGESGIPDVALRAYKQAEARLAVSDPGCGVPWTLLAAIGRVESNHGRFGGAQLRNDGSATRRIRGIPLDGRPNVALIRDSDGGALDGDTVYDRAVGPMQFIPSTWRAVNADGNGDGFGDPNNMFDAAQGAAQYLCTGTSNLRDQGRAAQAVRRYNNADSYVRVVLGLARMYQAGRVIGLPTTGDQLPNERTDLPTQRWIIDPPAARPWTTERPAAPPWTTEPPAARPWTADPPADRPTPTNPPAVRPSPADPRPDDTVLAKPAPPVQRTGPSTPPRGVSRPRTTAPLPQQPAPAAPSPGATASREPATTAPSEPSAVRPPQPRPATTPTPVAPEPAQTRPPRPAKPEPTTNPNPSETDQTRPSDQNTTQPSDQNTTRPSTPKPSKPEPSKPKASEPEPSESDPEPSESGSPTPAPSTDATPAPTRAQEPTTAAVGWAPAMREVVGRALTRSACPKAPSPQPAQPSETCPADSGKPSPTRDDKKRERCTPQKACKVKGSPR